MTDGEHARHSSAHPHHHLHPHAQPTGHALAAVFAHSHDVHTDGSHPADETDDTAPAGRRERRLDRGTMVGAPDRDCEFAGERHALALLYRALAGQAAELVAYDERTEPAPETVHTLYLPAHAPIDEHHGLTRAEWYRVAVTHRAAHLLFGTFRFDLDRAEPLFARRRPAHRADDPRPSLAQFTDTFADRALAVEIFVTLEDLRIDASAERILPGLAASYRLACHEALHDRPPLSMLAARDALAEALVQFSLGAAGVLAPSALDEPLAQVIAAARPLREPQASVESSAEAAIRVYDIVAGLPARSRHRSVRAIAFAELPDVAATDATGPTHRHAKDDAPDVVFYPVPFRDPSGVRHATGDPQSALSLAPAVLRPDTTDEPRDDDANADEQPADEDAGGRSTPGTADRHMHTSADDPVLPEVSRLAGVSPAGTGRVALDGGLRASAPGEYVYPEWDGVAGRYRTRWCLLRESRAVAATPTRRRRDAARHRALLPELVAALERVQPAGRDIVRRQPHGDDLDLDACVDAVRDLRAGIEPSDRVFTSMRVRRRDVAVAFAIDLSASTAEALPPDPAEPTRVRRTLDLQRDAVDLVVEALERVGDDYGIYGFSGSGRDDVRISVVKNLDERRSPQTLNRLAGLVPDHTTRMGPAIRHLSARLSRVDAATRILLVISDGRPYDIDYGQQYGEAATIGYALADTGRALAQARRAGVRPYLVTVDGGGADYLSEICDPREYHVIADARELPRSLAQLYVVARADAFRRRDAVQPPVAASSPA